MEQGVSHLHLQGGKGVQERKNERRREFGKESSVGKGCRKEDRLSCMAPPHEGQICPSLTCRIRLGAE